MKSDRDDPSIEFTLRLRPRLEREASYVQSVGSQIKGWVVGTAQTRILQGFRRLQRCNTDYTLVRKPHRDADSATTTRVRY
jgi:hypothetical protein